MKEWELYYKLEPFGEERADWRLAQLTCLTANLNRGKGKRVSRVADFMWKLPKKPKQTAHQIKGMLMALVKETNENDD